MGLRIPALNATLFNAFNTIFFIRYPPPFLLFFFFTTTTVFLIRSIEADDYSNAKGVFLPRARASQ